MRSEMKQGALRGNRTMKEYEMNDEIKHDKGDVENVAKAILSQGHVWTLGASLASGMSEDEKRKRMDEIMERETSKSADTDNPRSILEQLRSLHEELGYQIDEIEEDPEDAAAALGSIYAQMETLLDTLDTTLRLENGGVSSHKNESTGD